jgi:hypothetical protein
MAQPVKRLAVRLWQKFQQVMKDDCPNIAHWCAAESLAQRNCLVILMDDTADFKISMPLFFILPYHIFILNQRCYAKQENAEGDLPVDRPVFTLCTKQFTSTNH